jgi:hypothetical protein
MSAFEVMRRASLGVFGAIALACGSAPGGAFALTRAVGGIHVDVVPSAALRVIFLDIDSASDFCARGTRVLNAPVAIFRAITPLQRTSPQCPWRQSAAKVRRQNRGA